MFQALFKKKNSSPKIYATPEGEVAYAVGDIHGCLDSLLSLLPKLELDAAKHADKKIHLVFLGDLIDRGPQSKEVVEFLRTYKPGWADRMTFLMGNHEEVFLSVLKGRTNQLKSWFTFGGKSCLRSYGVDDLGEIMIDPEGLLYRIQALIPKNHIDFIKNFDDSMQFGDYLFVHAGIAPKVPIDKQTPQDMRWIRDKFLNFEKPHPLKIVHGHTIVEGPENLSNRIAIDTGVYNGSPLTAVRLDGTSVIFIQSND